MGMFVLAIPLVTALSFLAAGRKRSMHIINGCGAALLLLSSAYMTERVITLGTLSYKALGGFFYVDSLSIIVLDIILVVGFMACVYSIGYLDEEYRHNALDLRRMKIYYMLTYVFIFTMVLVVTTQNIGLMWIAIEATTLASAFLVGFYNNKHSLEAAWKYIIICSVGIALALLGIVFLNYSSANAFHNPGVQLNWAYLFQNAKALDGSILKISFIFILVGFGTKAGLAPMHTWLPDAHSQAPSP
jgi:hydrogenase-4 component F